MLSKDDSESDKYVCSDCIGDEEVSEAIKQIRTLRPCTYCKKKEIAVALELLADWVDEVYRTFVTEAEEVPDFDEDSDKVFWRKNGSSPSEVIAEMLQCADDVIAQDIVEFLSKKYSYDVGKDGDWDAYDDASDIYKISIPRDSRFNETWASFCYSIKHHQRFFNGVAGALLQEILKPITKGDWPIERPAVRVIKPGDPDAFIYRGRVANSPALRTEIFKAPISSLSAAPPALNTSGRMNSSGIPVFYGSFDATTCLAELRVPVGGAAVVGKFEIVRPIRVLDMTVFESLHSRISFFAPDAVGQYAYDEFLRGFHHEIRKPVIPGAEALEYLPTQFVAEYLWTMIDPPIDGLIYGSSQISDGAKNIALFPRANETEGKSEELLFEVSDTWEDPDDDVALVFRSPKGVPRQPNVAESKTGPATLRLLLNEISVLRVDSIGYKTTEHKVRFEERTSEHESKKTEGRMSDDDLF